MRWDTLVPLKPWAPPDPERRSHRLGFVYSREDRFGRAATIATTVAAPFWALVVPSVFPPGLWIVRRLRRRRLARRGLCPSCGYDLRASPERCPECGERVGANPPGGNAPSIA